MRESKSLAVYMGKLKVGTLAVTQKYLTAFEYDMQWLEHGFAISPLSLPLRREVFVPKGYDPLKGCSVFSLTVCRMAGEGFWWIECCEGKESTRTEWMP